VASLVTACQRGPCPPDTELRGSPKAGQQSCEYQDSNGTLVKHGPFLDWHPNGQKSSEGNYRHGKQDGHWVFWDEQGKKVAEREYRGGEIVSEKKL
jgi:antitoxin component YwqK of YwqJK toxin-antitoxin module